MFDPDGALPATFSSNSICSSLTGGQQKARIPAANNGLANPHRLDHAHCLRAGVPSALRRADHIAQECHGLQQLGISMPATNYRVAHRHVLSRMLPFAPGAKDTTEATADASNCRTPACRRHRHWPDPWHAYRGSGSQGDQGHSDRSILASSTAPPDWPHHSSAMTKCGSVRH